MATPITDAEMRLYYWQRGTAGSFTSALFELIGKADTFNKYKLSKGFPDEVAVFIRYQEEQGYWDKLKSKIEKDRS